jgi:sodium-dependent dicarboxylate transporter 2/3/5
MKTKSETNSPTDTNETEHEVIKQSEKARKLVTGFLLACSYSSTIGGLGSLVGTAPNVLLKGFFDERYPEKGLSFLTFTLFAMPVSVMLIIIAWSWICFCWLPRE